MTQKTIIKRQAYVTPDTSATIIEQDLNFMASGGQSALQDMELNELYDEDF